MRISPALLLLLLVLLVFAPAIGEWALRGGAQWYRPYLLWLVVVIFVHWVVRRTVFRSSRNANTDTEESG